MLFLGLTLQCLSPFVNILIQKLAHLVLSFPGMHRSLLCLPFVLLINWLSDSECKETVGWSTGAHLALGTQLKLFMSCESHLPWVSLRRGCVASWLSRTPSSVFPCGHIKQTKTDVCWNKRSLRQCFAGRPFFSDYHHVYIDQSIITLLVDKTLWIETGVKVQKNMFYYLLLSRAFS